jgi:hypothetical protein
MYPLTTSDGLPCCGTDCVESSVRFQPIPKYVLEWMEARLRVEEKIRQSVIFVGFKGEHGFLPYGTGLLGIAMYEDMGIVNLVTAKHVVDDVVGEKIWVRLNRRDGTTETKALTKSSAISFKNKAVDLAVFPLIGSGDVLEYDIYPITLASKAWEDQVNALGRPGPGDEVCVVGLYTTHYGHIRNIPVVRIGHIAALPEELVMTNRGYVPGYLIECHSIAGLSGSPVYLTVPDVKSINGEIKILTEAAYIPLGILIGYHVIEGKDDSIVVPQFQQPPEKRTYNASTGFDERRTGFGVVIPIQFVYEIFDGEQMQKILKDNIERVRRESGFRNASAAPSAASEERGDGAGNPHHREDFTSLLNAAGKTKPQGDQT